MPPAGENEVKVATEFVRHYWSLLGTTQARAGLATLYQAHSQLSFEGTRYTGQQAIVQFLTSLTFQLQQAVTSMDVHIAHGCLIIFVTGNLIIDGNQQDIKKFSQVFVLANTNNNYWLAHDFFRLNPGNPGTPQAGLENETKLATEFVQHYWSGMTSNRAGLGSLYQAESTLSFEGQSSVGQQAIAAKLTGLTMQLQHQLKSLEVQVFSGCLLIFVNGDLVVDGGNVVKFSQTFLLASTNNSFWLLSDFFRLNYG